ncbi:MAG TPA: haloalkane dehalogenase [Ferrovibrio sp.]|uniref:haloalkane dehalogenase n=1 Tax=Ferrovibrio sp. TaxID=1917215 RepID=UPI002B4B074A|nr:haloalkane dehalogenase [Ferrovibrio sp.]HLT77122.1 haloalkane dehalogenase [Ferrovibrio sp.]
MIEALRTPDERFENLPGYDYTPHYLTHPNGLRMHYVDVGQTGTRTFLCLHGQPTWSYLYRRMIPVLSRPLDHRVVAPDLFGFGRSDKPKEDAVYTFDFHRDSLLHFIRALDLQNITLVCQDWGGLLGLTLPMEMPERFTGLLVMNTALGTGDQPLTQGFLDWRAWNNKNPDMAIAKLMKRSCPHLSDAEAAAYEAPYPDVTYKGGVRRFPNLVPDAPDAPGAELSRKALQFWKNEWSGKSFMAIGMTDPVLGAPVMRGLRKVIRNCPEPLELPEAGHFVQEWGERVAEEALARL